MIILLPEFKESIVVMWWEMLDIVHGVKINFVSV